MVGVGVAEHHPLQPAQLLRRGLRLLPHRLGPGVELDDAVAVLEEVDVHRPAEVPAQQPDAVRDLLQSHRPTLTRATGALGFARALRSGKPGWLVLVVCLFAAMVIAIVRLVDDADRNPRRRLPRPAGQGSTELAKQR